MHSLIETLTEILRAFEVLCSENAYNYTGLDFMIFVKCTGWWKSYRW